jgi:hypothetical protein
MICLCLPRRCGEIYRCTLWQQSRTHSGECVEGVASMGGVLALVDCIQDDDGGLVRMSQLGERQHQEFLEWTIRSICLQCATDTRLAYGDALEIFETIIYVFFFLLSLTTASSPPFRTSTWHNISPPELPKCAKENENRGNVRCFVGDRSRWNTSLVDDRGVHVVKTRRARSRELDHGRSHR